MKCTSCDRPLDETHTYLVGAFTTGGSYVANLHPSCLRALVGRHPFDQLTRLVYRSGWHQLELPEFRSKPARAP